MPSALNPVLVLIAFLSIILACLLGSTPLGLGQVFAGLLSQGTEGDNIVIIQIRLPRALAAFFVGAALGISGAALQGLLRNPLAEPGILGVSAFASLAATFVIYYGLATSNPWLVPLTAITGALFATTIIALAAIKTRSVVTLILIGVGLSSFAGAAMSLLLNLAPNPFTLADMINWTLGSVANRSLDDLTLAAPFIAIGGLILYLNRRGLTALTLGEEAASGLGVNLKSLRIYVVLGAGLATGAAVSIAGAIGFVGIVAPHVIRPFVRHDPARALIPSALLAGIFLVLADIGVRIAPTQTELKLGVVAAIIGAPAFIFIAMKQYDRGGQL